MIETSRRDFVMGLSAAAITAEQLQAADTIKLAIVGTGHRAWQHIELMSTTRGF